MSFFSPHYNTTSDFRIFLLARRPWLHPLVCELTFWSLGFRILVKTSESIAWTALTALLWVVKPWHHFRIEGKLIGLSQGSCDSAKWISSRLSTKYQRNQLKWFGDIPLKENKTLSPQQRKLQLCLSQAAFSAHTHTHWLKCFTWKGAAFIRALTDCLSPLEAGFAKYAHWQHVWGLLAVFHTINSSVCSPSLW